MRDPYSEFSEAYKERVESKLREVQHIVKALDWDNVVDEMYLDVLICVLRVNDAELSDLKGSNAGIPSQLDVSSYAWKDLEDSLCILAEMNNIMFGDARVPVTREEVDTEATDFI